MWRNLPLLTASSLVVLAGIVHGLWNDRWRTASEVREAVARLVDVPRDLGDWRGTDLELSPEEVRAGRIAGYCYRRYENPRNRDAVIVLLVCGRPGPIAVHTPDVCFEGAGFRRVGSPVPFTVAYGTADREADLWTIRMRREEAAFLTELRVFWSWNGENSWQALEQPRVNFARHRSLYKLYVLHGRAGEDAGPEAGPCVPFMRLLLPELDRALFGSR